MLIYKTLQNENVYDPVPICAHTALVLEALEHGSGKDSGNSATVRVKSTPYDM
jgi:hypothetical protein